MILWNDILSVLGFDPSPWGTPPGEGLYFTVYTGWRRKKRPFRYLKCSKSKRLMHRKLKSKVMFILLDKCDMKVTAVHEPLAKYYQLSCLHRRRWRKQRKIGIWVTKYYQFWKFGENRYRHLDLGTTLANTWFYSWAAVGWVCYQCYQWNYFVFLQRVNKNYLSLEHLAPKN